MSTSRYFDRICAAVVVLGVLFTLLFMNGAAFGLQASEKAASACLEKHTRRCVVKSKTVQKGLIELNCEIRLLDDNTDFINQLADLNGVQSAVLVSYNGDYMG